jgi:maltose alpha-D-glucosyltransferase/alpha-amylase
MLSDASKVEDSHERFLERREEREMSARGVDHGPDELLAFLKTKRWFGDKARRIRAVTVRDSVPVEWPNSDKPFSVLRLDVEADEGTSTYQAFIERGTGRMNDALEDPDFRRGLIDAFVQDLVFEQDAVRWRFTSEGKGTLVAPPTAVIRLSGAEQSNSSVIVDGQAILKLFRKLEPGIHPDVEVTRFLTIDRQFVNVPVLLGTVAFEDSHGTTIAGMLQELVPGAVDGWTHALRMARAFLDGGQRRRTATADSDDADFGGDAEQLGIVTRALHETLASGDPGTDFERRPVGDDDLRRWTQQTTAMIDRATTSLRRAIDAGSVPARALGQANAVAQAGDRVASRMLQGARAMGTDRGSKTRTHGDYHLGQLLRSATGQFLVIDFEGEPARPLSERRAHQSPLRDVAGMLRSFAYAAAVGAAEAGGGADVGERARRWERETRDAFLRGYFREHSAGKNAILPSRRENADRLLTLFETEKIFYELQYELDHRPEWVWIPLSGIAQQAT